MSLFILVATSLLAATESESTVAAAPEAAAQHIPMACERWKNPGLLEGPARASMFDADTVSGRRACARTEVGLEGRFRAIIDTPNFYGDVHLDGQLHGSYVLVPRTELFFAFEVVRSDYVQNAVLKTTTLSVGQLTTGASWTFHEAELVAVALSGRIMWPTGSHIPNSRLMGFELGGALTFRPHDAWELHAALGADLSFVISAATPDARPGANGLVGVQFSPFSWAALVLDVAGRWGPTSALMPIGGLRFRIGPVGLELSGGLPLIGNDRHDFFLSFNTSVAL